MMRRTLWAAGAIVAMVVSTCLLEGCSSPGYDKAEARVASILEVKGIVEDGKKQVDATLAALDAVSASANTDPRPPYTKLVAEMGTMNALIEKGRARSLEMQERSKEYFDAWEESLNKVTDPELRQRAEERRAAGLACFNGIRDSMTTLKTSLDPFEKTLQNIKQYLDVDLNLAAIQSLADKIVKLRGEGATIQKNCDQVLSKLEAVAKATSPKNIEPPPPPPAPTGTPAAPAK
jgi:hypothetical protein